VVVVGALALLWILGAAQRWALYRHRSRRAWTIDVADHGGLLGFAILKRIPSVEFPEGLLFVICKPSGAYITELPTPQVGTGAGVVPYPPGVWIHVVEQPYERRSYEVRVYGTSHRDELARATVEV